MTIYHYVGDKKIEQHSNITEMQYFLLFTKKMSNKVHSKVVSIKRSGVVRPTYVICIKALIVDKLVIKEGDKYELLHDMGSMYVLKNPDGGDLIVPKDSFEDIEIR